MAIVRAGPDYCTTVLSPVVVSAADDDTPKTYRIGVGRYIEFNRIDSIR